MKRVVKLFIALLAVVIIISCSGCSESSTIDDKGIGTEQAVSTETPSNKQNMIETYTADKPNAISDPLTTQSETELQELVNSLEAFTNEEESSNNGDSSGKVLIKDIPVHLLLDFSPKDADDTFGRASGAIYSRSDKGLIYDGFTIYFDWFDGFGSLDWLDWDLSVWADNPNWSDRSDWLYWYFWHELYMGNLIYITNPSILTIDGVTLDKNRAGLITVLGNDPEDEDWNGWERSIFKWEGWEDNTYILELTMWPYCVIRFEMSSPDEIAHLVTVRRYSDGPGPADIPNINSWD